MNWASTVAASVTAAVVLWGAFLQFAHYNLKGKRSRNRSYLLAAAGLLLVFVSLMGTQPLRPVLLLLTRPQMRLATFLAGCVFLLSALATFLYLTYLRPYRLRFEDRLVQHLPDGPAPEDQ